MPDGLRIVVYASDARLGGKDILRATHLKAFSLPVKAHETLVLVVAPV